MSATADCLDGPTDVQNSDVRCEKRLGGVLKHYCRNAEYVAAAQLCARDRRYPGSMSTLGACLYRASRIEEAIETLNRSSEQLGSGGVPHDWVFLALCHVSLGNMELATDYLLRVESWLDARISCWTQ